MTATVARQAPRYTAIIAIVLNQAAIEGELLTLCSKRQDLVADVLMRRCRSYAGQSVWNADDRARATSGEQRFT